MDFANVKSITIAEGEAASISCSDVLLWEGISYTNIIDMVGYEEGYLSSSSGNVSSKTGYRTLKLIEIPTVTSYAEGQVVLYLKNVKFSATDNYCRVGYYDSAGAKLYVASLSGGGAVLGSEGYNQYKINYWVEDGYVVKIDLSGAIYTSYANTAKYIRLSSAGIDESSIITLNEPIE